MTRVPSDHLLGELYDRHPTSSGNMNQANNFDMILRDPPIPDLPSRICRHITARYALLKKGVD